MRRKTVVALFFALTLCAQRPTSYRVNDGWGPHTDKILHFGVGAAIGMAAYKASERIGNNNPWWDVLFWSLFAALYKENYDRHHGGRPDPADAAYTVAGAVAMTFAIKFGDQKKAEFASIPKAP